MNDVNVYKIAIAAFMHDIGKFAERGGLAVSDTYINNNADLYQPYYDGRHSHKHAVYTAAFIEQFEKCLPRRKLPRQVDSSKVEFPALFWRYSSGVKSPSASWGRLSL